MTDAPIMMLWDGETMRPASHFWRARADVAWTVGERYAVEAVEERSARSHNHYFAALHDAWDNLPDGLLEHYPSVEHLRKKALILTGFRDERSIICSSPREAARMAAFIRPLDDFAVVSVNEEAVVVWTAKSQNMRAMRKDEFQKSKQAVLDFCATLIGVESMSKAIEPETIRGRNGKLVRRSGLSWDLDPDDTEPDQ